MSSRRRALDGQDAPTAAPELGDRRANARVAVSIDIEVTVAARRRRARLRDLSQDGARLIAPTSIGQLGDPIELELPLAEGFLRAPGDIIRAEDLADGHHVAVLFNFGDPAVGARLEELLDLLLAGPGGGRRAHPRVASRMEVQVLNRPTMRAILEDISAGGAGVTVFEAVAAGERLQLVIRDAHGVDGLLPIGRVVNHRLGRQHGSVRLGLQFEIKTDAERYALEALVRYMARDG